MATNEDTMMDAKKVDVLAVLDDGCRALHGYGMDPSPLLEARSAVFDLARKAATASALMKSLIEALGENEFTEGDRQVVEELDAVLTRIGAPA